MKYAIKGVKIVIGGVGRSVLHTKSIILVIIERISGLWKAVLIPDRTEKTICPIMQR